MRIFFVVKELKMEPLGIMYLSAALRRAGHAVRLERCDCVGVPGVSTIIQQYRPDFVCYSVCSGNEDYYLDLDSKLRRLAMARFKSVFGGPAVTFTPERFEGRLVVRGEGEEAIVSMVEGREPPKHPELVDVNAISEPYRDIVYRFPDLFESPIKNMISRRGCRYSCSYCFNHQWNRLHKGQFPEIVRHRDVGSVITEAEGIRRRWPVELISFVDDNFVTSDEWLEEFAEQWPSRVGLPFFCSVRPDDLTERNALLLAKAGGAVVNMALECANDYHRVGVLKRICTKGAVVRALNLVHGYGMRSRLQNMIGLPVSDPLADAYETLDFNIKHKSTNSWCAILQAYKGTSIHEYARRGGYISEKGEPTDSGFFGRSALKIRQRVLIERLHKLWPIITQFPLFFRPLVPLLIRVPLPFSWLVLFFRFTKRYLAEKLLWKLTFPSKERRKK